MAEEEQHVVLVLGVFGSGAVEGAVAHEPVLGEDPVEFAEYMADKVDADRYIMRCIRLNDVSHFYGSGNEYTGAPREGWYLPREHKDVPQV